MKTAIVHEWIVDIGGSERCLESMHRVFPADVFTLVCREDSAQSLGIDASRITTSFLQKFPQATRRYRSYLPFFPLAVEQFDVSRYDLVISSSHAVAKGVLVNAGQTHICYCYTPMRYAWDLYHQYLRDAGLDRGCKGWLAKLVLHYLRVWDLGTAQRVDHFAAISHFIAHRIKRVYGRDATVIYPPVDVDRFELGTSREEYYLAASRMVPYKKIDIIVQAFSRMPGKRLVVIGDGPDFDKVKSLAGRNVELLGYQPFPVMKEHLQKAKAFLFAAEEDFGILPVEAQACGTPVIAYGKGGLLETTVPLGSQNSQQEHPATGMFFDEQTPEAIAAAITQYEQVQDHFDHAAVRKHAEQFSRGRFEREFRAFVELKMQERIRG